MLSKWKAYRKTTSSCKFSSYCTYHPKYKKHRYELVDEPKKQPNRILLHGGIAIGIIKDCRTVTENVILKEG